MGASLPVFRIDPTGEPIALGRLHALDRDQYWFDAPLGVHAQLSDGLPFFLQDLIPQGFLGRTIPRRFPELGLPDEVTDWRDEHVLSYLSHRSEDCIGDLVLGDESLERYLKQAPAESAQQEHGYPLLSDLALCGAPAGSPMGGEHPKFTASIRHGESVRHVLVKFSPRERDAAGQRWSDLLISEHLAIRVLRDAGLTPSATELLIADGRTFVEAERFDRHGPRGRSGLVSLAALANQYLGSYRNWVDATASLAKMQLICDKDAETVRRLAAFGRLIANTDMHFGNLSFHLCFERQPALAPVYDMLPMMYAPTGRGALLMREFDPPLPTRASLDIWKETTGLAIEYWRQVSSHPQISTDFAAIARRNAQRVAAVADFGPAGFAGNASP